MTQHDIPSLSATGDVARKILALFYFSGMILALIDYGGNSPLNIAVMALLYFSIILAVLLIAPPPSATRSALWLASLILMMLLAWVFLQSSVLPNRMFANLVWNDALTVLPLVAKRTISVTPGDDMPAFIKIALSFAVFMSGLLLFPSERSATKALRMMAIGGGVIACLSILQFSLLPKTLLLAEKKFYRDSLTGVFINRNTAATFFGLIGILLATFFWRSAAQIRLTHFLNAIEDSRRISSDQKKQLIQCMSYAILTLITIIALALTKSRAGSASGFAGLLLLVVFITLRKTPRTQSLGKRSRLARLALAATVSAVILFVFVGISTRALLRAEVFGFDDARFCLMPGILDLIRDNLPFGSGPSSFGSIFPSYRDGQCGLTGWVDKAHNVYAEGILGLGVLFPMILVAGVGALLRSFVICIRYRRQYRFAGEAGLAIMLMVCVHSIVDFSVQISGFAMALAAVLAPLITISLRPPGASEKSPAGEGASDPASSASNRRR